MIHYTDDVSGWMEPYKNSAGAAGMLQLWKLRQGYTPDGPFLVLSGGDMWTGPAVPALTAGESMTDIMNRTMYQSARGKQDFAFDLDAIHQRAAQAEFAGLHKAEDWVLEDGTPLQDDRWYTVLVPDTLYAGGNYYELSQADPTPIWTGIDWRQPVLDWLQQNPTSWISPLDDLLGVSVAPAD